MWKETTAPEQTRNTAPAATARSINEDELRTILERLEATRDIFRENLELRTRNLEMEEMMRKFAPLLVNAGTAMGLAAKNEKPETKIFT